MLRIEILILSLFKMRGFQILHFCYSLIIKIKKHFPFRWELEIWHSDRFYRISKEKHLKIDVFSKCLPLKLLNCPKAVREGSSKCMKWASCLGRHVFYKKGIGSVTEVDIYFYVLQFNSMYICISVQTY